MRTIDSLDSCLRHVKTVGISGHVRPDGDCVGSCMAVYHYIRDNFPDISADVYLEEIPESLAFLKGTEKIRHSCQEERVYDLFIALDCSDRERLGEAGRYFEAAEDTVCIDHHISNAGLGRSYAIEPSAAATCEVLYELMDPEKISDAAAECLYTGLIHDTGVFQYSNTSPKTMRIGAALMEKHVPFTKIIEENFYEKTYLQNQILGRALLESIVFMDGACIASYVKKNVMEFYGVTPKDLEGIVSQLRVTKGVEVAIFMYEQKTNIYKVSLRSKDKIDVSRIAQYFGGGGHRKAAGFTMHGSPHDVLNNLSEQIELQMRKTEE